MAELKKLNRWAERLLDTGKRNNLINFRDTKMSSARVAFPECEKVFSKCSVGNTFDVFDPKIPDDDFSDDEYEQNQFENTRSMAEFRDLYAHRIRNDRTLLIYAQTPNPLTAVKNIAKKSQEMLDETGINVSYLAFGFVKWNEKEGSEVYYRAPILLVHVNIITGSVIDTIKIEISDDDVIVNPTFAYYLQAEYGMTLPEFEDGDTLAAYYSKVAYTVKRMGWEILDECKLGTFSFLKINMYEDLKTNAKQILQNNNVKMLLGEKPSENNTDSTVESTKRVVNPLIELHTVVEADSSQIEAIEMAKSGKSFVLQGPPGTGKSQTITNIIAELLHDGKKVLFVSEKQAALNVVFDKLKKAGLADFCLELHSHKANKKVVIEELNRTLEMPKSAVSPSVQEEIRQKEEAQNKLDTYATELHKKRDVINDSLYQLFELFSAQRDLPELSIPIRNIETKGQDYLRKAVSLLDQYAEYTASIGLNYRLNPWYGFTNLQTSYEERNGLSADLDSLAQGYRQLLATTKRVQEKYRKPELTICDSQAWASLLEFFSCSDVITPLLLSKTALDHALPHLKNMMELSKVIAPIKKQIVERFDEKALVKHNGRDLYEKLNGKFSSAFARLISGEYKSIIAELSTYYCGGKKLKYRQALDFAEHLTRLQDAMTEYKNNENAILGYLGAGYNGVDTDWDLVMSDIKTLQGFLKNDESFFGTIAKMDKNVFEECQNTFRSDSEELYKDLNAVKDVKNRIAKQFSDEILDLDKTSYDLCIRKLELCVSNIDKLGNWIGFANLLQQLQTADLQDFIDQIISNEIVPNKIIGTYKRVFYRQWIEYILFSVPELASFSRVTQDQLVKIFTKKDSIQYEINKAQIKSELSQTRPNLDIVAGGSAVAILRREGQKRRKQMPIRKLLAETSSLVQIIKPCFLMSPLSVSTFLDSERIRFDTVVFDEASQIFPQDAIGAIYRGKQLIVVGDSRQMPPSNFFNSSVDIDEEDEEVGDVTDFESILDICSSVFTTERLAWHYRSHYEQLIAFSNCNFYNNNLVTFPSSSTDHKGIGVDFYYVDGVFDRKSKTNRAEAEFIVDLIYQNISEHPDRSLGVVAFSVAQQNLIDKLLSKRREADQSFEWFFKTDCPEPFFIKNLETVQGDERDTIIFSIAYAKDSQGRFIHNFGPLNRTGGERRLNVAVTRAKDNVQLVASIHYTDINLSNTGNEGVRLLRAYLDYAENGEQALERTITNVGQDQFDSYFEQEVCDFLRDHRFTVDTQIGCSGYKIDLGIRKPDSSNYLLAIECDGATYHSSKNARDRDSLRQRILEKMGWRFYRIWSTDWYKNTAIEKERLLKVAKEVVLFADAPEEKSATGLPEETKVQADAVQERFVTMIQSDNAVFDEYKQLNALSIISKHPASSFQTAIKEILEIEAPLSEEYLLKRIVSYFDREKVTKIVLDEFNSKMYRCINAGILRKDGFLYLQGKNKIKMRVPGVRREIKYISIEELADGFYKLIEQNVTVTREGLYKAMTNLLGFNRTGDAISERYNKALGLLLKSGEIVMEDESIHINQSSSGQ